MRLIGKHIYQGLIETEEITTDEIINELFVIGFTEEEIMQIFDLSEDDIDSANMRLE